MQNFLPNPLAASFLDIKAPPSKFRTRLMNWFAARAERARTTKSEEFLDGLDARERYDLGLSDVRCSGIAAVLNNHPSVVACHVFQRKKA